MYAVSGVHGTPVAHVRTLEIGHHFNTSYCKEQFSLRPWTPNQGNVISKVPQERSHSEH